MTTNEIQPWKPGTSSSRVLDPTGKPLTRDDLPAANTKRWVVRRKARVVAGVKHGLITLEEACERYQLSIAEFLSWQRQLDRHGINGLMATQIKKYRD